MNSNEYIWAQKYRPSKVSDCILPERIKKQFQAFVDQKTIPNLILSGPPGTGKTSVAMAMCEELGISYLMKNASSDRGIALIRNEINEYASALSWDGTPKVIILDEADNLTSDAQDALKAAIESFSSNCTLIFTCNQKAKLIEPLHSRCANIDFYFKKDEKPLLALEFYKKLQDILVKENVPFSKNGLKIIIEKFFPDFRRTLNELQRLAISGKISDDISQELVDPGKISELFKALKDKDFRTVRAWISNNLGNIDITRLYRVFYEEIGNYLQTESIPIAILILAKYQFQATFSIDQELNFSACILELMGDCQFK